LYPKSNWGTRVFDAFRIRWEQLGGKLLEAQSYNSAEHDFSAPIQALLNVTDSKQRHRALQRVLGTKIEFEPRRRQDAGFIFLAAKSQLARQVRPQLQFHRAANLPVYTTSHAYSGVPAPKMDLDLEGITFPDIPWLLMAGENNQSLKKELPKKLAAYGRLFAMGIDAYELLPHLARLEMDSGETLDGKTGILYLDRQKQVHRQLVWARMKGGKPKVIGYAPPLEERPGILFPTPSFLR
jgi:outer membrane PBP1 activator LpoA protein